MKSPELPVPWKRFFSWLAGAAVLLYLFSRFLPVAPPVHYGEIEDSFIQFLHTAFVEHLQFGSDVVYTYGPWGFLFAGYLPATHAVALFVWIALSLVLFWGGWRMARHFSKSTLVAWIWLICFVAVAGHAFSTPIDTRLMSFVLLLWSLYFLWKTGRSHPCSQRW